jgi:hypothetical protein
MENKRNQKVMEHNLRVPSYEQNKEKEFPGETFELASKKSTRELAAEWFSSKTYLEQHAFSDKYFGSKNPSLLTIEQVEEIWKKEFSHHTDEYFSKPNQKKFISFEDCKKAKINSKQFKEFNRELFKSYIDKFSDEDKMKALFAIADALGYNSYLAQGDIDLRQKIK